MNWKETYTKIFLKNANKSIDDATVKQYMPLWWQNTRSKKRTRVTNLSSSLSSRF